MLESVGEIIIKLANSDDNVRAETCDHNMCFGLCKFECKHCYLGSKENLQLAARYVKNGKIS